MKKEEGRRLLIRGSLYTLAVAALSACGVSVLEPDAATSTVTPEPAIPKDIIALGGQVEQLLQKVDPNVKVKAIRMSTQGKDYAAKVEVSYALSLENVVVRSDSDANVETEVLLKAQKIALEYRSDEMIILDDIGAAIDFRTNPDLTITSPLQKSNRVLDGHQVAFVINDIWPVPNPNKLFRDKLVYLQIN